MIIQQIVVQCVGLLEDIRTQPQTKLDRKRIFIHPGTFKLTIGVVVHWLRSEHSIIRTLTDNPTSIEVEDDQVYDFKEPWLTTYKNQIADPSKLPDKNNENKNTNKKYQIHKQRY